MIPLQSWPRVKPSHHTHQNTMQQLRSAPQSRHGHHPPARTWQRAAACTRTRAKAARQPDAVCAHTLVEAAAGQQFGASSSEQQTQTLLQLVADLKQQSHSAAPSSAQQPPPTSGPLQGDWRLLWTSEASVHGIVRGLLPVTDIQQRVDLTAQRVTNTIAFGWLGLQLQASGPLTVLSASRIFYSFDQLSLTLPCGLQLPLPVLFKGGGWTDCVLLLPGVEGSVLRVMENSRRDTLVLVRVGV